MKYGEKVARKDVHDDALHTEAMRQYKVASEQDQENRERGRECVEFFLGDQWPEEAKKMRKDRPMLTVNVLPQFVNQIVNEARKNTPQVKVLAQDSNADPDTAEVINGVIRNIESSSQAKQTYVDQLRNATVGGWGAWRINVEYSHDDTFDKDLVIKSIANPLNAIPYDYTSPDASDAKSWFVTDKISDKEAEAYGIEEADFADHLAGAPDDWKEDGKIQICEWWTYQPHTKVIYLLADGRVVEKLDPGMQVVDQREVQSKKVCQYIITGHKIVAKNDWMGKLIPIVAVLGEEMWLGEKRIRHSAVYHAMDSQRMINYDKSAAAERRALTPKSPWLTHEDATEGHEDTWATANTGNHAYLSWAGQIPPERVQPVDVGAADIASAEQAKNDLYSVTGIYPAQLGDRMGNESGETLIQRQKRGDIATYHWIDTLRRAIEVTGRILVDMIPHVYNTPRMMRIMGVEGNPQMMPVNQQFIVNGIQKTFDLTVGKYDVTCTAGAGYSTQREEASNAMVEVIRSNPAAAPILAPRLFKMWDWPGAPEIAREFEAMKQAEQQNQQNSVDKQMIEAQKQQMQLFAQVEQGKMQISQMKQQLEQLKAAGEQNLERQQLELDRQELMVKAAEAKEKILTERIKQLNELQAGSAPQGPQITNVDSSFAPALNGAIESLATTLVSQLQQTIMESNSAAEQRAQMMMTGLMDGLQRSSSAKVRAVRQKDGSWLRETVAE